MAGYIVSTISKALRGILTDATHLLVGEDPDGTLRPMVSDPSRTVAEEIRLQGSSNIATAVRTWDITLVPNVQFVQGLGDVTHGEPIRVNALHTGNAEVTVSSLIVEPGTLIEIADKLDPHGQLERTRADGWREIKLEAESAVNICVEAFYA